MLNQNEHFATTIEDAFTCYHSDRGCLKIPVRMVMEWTGEVKNGIPMIDGVMLCRTHSATYRPSGQVISDQQIVSDENLKFLQQNNL